MDAHYGAAKTFDYYKNTHGRNGIFGNGAGVPSRVHYGNNYVNAFWDGSQMTYGDGSGNARPLVALDVAAHEMSHGVTENAVPGLTYSGESGGLNEATSDIFGTMVEFYADNSADPGDYQVGEKININGNGTPLRYMYNPRWTAPRTVAGPPAPRTSTCTTRSGVGQPLLLQPRRGHRRHRVRHLPVCGSAPRRRPASAGPRPRRSGSGRWTSYFTSNTSYVNTANPANTARAYSLPAATDLYGSCSTEYKAVQAAWTAVNVAGSDAACPTGNDFSRRRCRPSPGSVNPGSSVTTTVDRHLPTARRRRSTFSASGLPSGASAAFSPASVTRAARPTLTISTSASTTAGTVLGHRHRRGAVTRSASPTGSP